MTGSSAARSGQVAAVAGALLGGVLGLVARLRDGRALHPRGVVLPGRLERFGGASGIEWVDGVGSEQVVVRLSRGGGLPAWLPDVHGLAIRHDGGDLLLSGTGTAPVLRHVLAPRRRPADAAYGSLLPFRGPEGPVLLAALPSPRWWPADLGHLVPALRVEPMRLDLAWATPAGPWRVFGRLVVGPPDGRSDREPRFDPADVPAGLRTYPWVAAVRTRAYAASQRHDAASAHRGAPSAVHDPDHEARPSAPTPDRRPA